MQKILVTGGSGFVGSNVIPYLKQEFDVYAPTRAELDVRDSEAVKNCMVHGNFDAIIHLASPTPLRSACFDSYDNLFKDMLQIYMNFWSVRNFCSKIIYSGSGAEYDKGRDIVYVEENDIGMFVPVDDYGRAKYIMNEMARTSNNIYNLRIFGCFGPNEYSDKFITHAINCCRQNKPITIRQDCKFDYMYVDDYARFLLYFLKSDPKFHDYNACSGRGIYLSEIADIVKKVMGTNNEVVILKDGYNKEYTANNARIINETGVDMLSLEEGIERLVSHMTECGG